MTPAQPKDRHAGQNIPTTDVSVANAIPPPRAPLFDSLRRLVPRAPRPSPPDLDAIFEELAEVAVWTSQDGDWQEHASFLLRTSDGNWHSVGFGDPVAGELTSRLRTLPGCDTSLLLDLIGERTRRIVTLWCHPHRRARP
ncbi:MAG TPA: hypothetical protein VFE65_26355 [Pseudonocardia sp.]|nr:hypothetical protein [Pseudonocardia sp.]